ncbi:hypothetical protein BOO86_01240 [Mycobacterium sp. CBMA 234]|uniref:hypothetical protein n=1 Tax=Mycolicibacterium sp. CBMA 234 TaxID=1918495 RepID=UPI0012DC9FC2|nr:hypothetical protein [Mycolicibacterium sp. CBMA 234]MUL63073.1 hypothetical protein [Mycolicibacterium sp. CBMA 234]
MIGIIAFAMIVVAAVLPWYTAHNDHGHGSMSGWGLWDISGNLGAELRPLPFAVLILVAAGTMIAGAVRALFGIALAAAIACFVVSLLPLMTGGAVDRRLAGSDSVAVVLGQAVPLMIGIAFTACVVSWIGYARCVLRAAPKAEAQAQPA